MVRKIVGEESGKEWQSTLMRARIKRRGNFSMPRTVPTGMCRKCFQNEGGEGIDKVYHV